MVRCGFCNQCSRFGLKRYSLLTVVCVLSVVSLFVSVVYVIKLPSRHLFLSFGRPKPTGGQRRCPPLPKPSIPSRLPGRFPGLSCSPRYHLGFLKTHRCGSSAVQNILFRFAAHHGLVPMLPLQGSHMIGDGPFQAVDSCDMPGRKLGFHLINVATRWNHPQIQRVMPNDTVFFSIVREPVSQFVSMFHHLELDRFTSLADFVSQDPIPATRLGGVFGRNQQLWDFGLPEDQLTDEQAIKKKVAEIDRQFELVMVAERMDESLVLLRHLLCWPTEYVVVLRLNTLMSSPAESIPESSPVRQRLTSWLSGDRLLYRHFYDRFEERVRRFGDERMRQEVKTLREKTLRVVNECKITRSPSGKLSEEHKWQGDGVYGFTARNQSQDCQMYVVGERAWLTIMRQMVDEFDMLFIKRQYSL